MRKEIDNEMLTDITGGAIDYHWSKSEQSGSVSSNITGETFYFGADKANAVFEYVMAHRMDSDESQMNAIRNIINS